MNMCPAPSHSAPCRRRRRPAARGFSFTEILFAVMILGIGFIMVAAMFPVAIRQTEATNQETIAASLGRAGSNCFSKIATIPWPINPPTNVATTSLLLPTFAVVSLPAASTYTLPANQTVMTIPGQVWTLYDSRDIWKFGGVNHNAYLWASTAYNFIQPGDSRFAWVGMYRRDLIATGTAGQPATSLSLAPYAQIIVLGIQARNTQNYVWATDIQNPPTTTPFLPVLVSNVALTPPAAVGGNSTVSFQSATGPQAEGTYVIVSDDHKGGAMNGRIYRIGLPTSGGSTPPIAWNFAPGEGMAYGDPTLTAADVLIVGRGMDPTNGGQRGGPTQDISVYTTFVQVPN